MFAATKSFEHIVPFSLVSNGLELLKSLVTKLPKHNQDIYKAYQMIDNVVSILKGFRDNVDIEFEHWLNFAVKSGKEVNTVPSVQGLAKNWS